MKKHTGKIGIQTFSYWISKLVHLLKIRQRGMWLIERGKNKQTPLPTQGLTLI